MFTGLVEAVGTVSAIRKMGNSIMLCMRPSCDFETAIGDSVCVSGVCLTVVQNNRDICFDISPETMRSTSLGALRVNEIVNLERSMRLSDRLGGHIVTGHVDGTGTVRSVRQEGDYTFFTFDAPLDILKYTVKKGSIAVDGISLTVVNVDGGSFSVALIPHTLKVTAIGKKAAGDRVNLEADIIGKYVEKFLSGSEDGRLMNLLREQGYTHE